MRFLNCTNGKVPSHSILAVGVNEALAESGFDEAMFGQRGGVYDWNRSIPAAEQSTGCASKVPEW